MLRVQLSLIVLLVGASALVTPWWYGMELSEAAKQSARVTTARAAKVASLGFERQARQLVNEALETAEKGEKSPWAKEPADQHLRWHLDPRGVVTTIYGGVALKPGIDLSGIEVVAAAQQGVASDGVVNLRVQPKASLWHLAAAPVSDTAGKLSGVVVVGVRLSQSARLLAAELQGLTNTADSSLRLGLIVGGKRYGDLPDLVAGKVRRGFPLGEPAGHGNKDVGPFIRLNEAAWMVSAQPLQTQAGPGFIVAATDVSAGLGPLADLLQTGLLMGLGLTVIGLVMVLFAGRRLSASANTLAGWLSDWRVGESSPIPLASLSLHPLFRRVRGALDLALEGKRATREPESILDTLVPGGEGEFGTDTMNFPGLGDDVEFGSADMGDAGDDLFAPAPDDEPFSEGPGAGPGPEAPSGGPTLPPIPAAAPAQAQAAEPAAVGGGELNQFKVADDGQIAPEDPAGFGDMATGQFSVPETLLEQISNDEIETGARPYEETYNDYVAMRQTLGEDIESITYDRFRKKIEHTRAKILEDTGARDVRFSVKEKNGRASLRAMPVMDT